MEGASMMDRILREPGFWLYPEEMTMDAQALLHRLVRVRRMLVVVMLAVFVYGIIFGAGIRSWL
jgi:hypothetical protein